MKKFYNLIAFMCMLVIFSVILMSYQGYGSLSYRYSCSDITISSNAIPKPTTRIIRLYTEGEAADDTLATIAAGYDWQIVYLVILVNTRDVHIVETGNIRVPSAIELNQKDDILGLIYNPFTSRWIAITWMSNV